jgi:hypothetical protein
MKILPILLTLLTGLSATLLTGAGAFGQKYTPSEDVHASLLAGKKRSLIAYAGTGHSFTLDVPFRTSKPSDVPGFVTIDKQIVQTTIVPVDRSINISGLTPAREQEILTKYMNYELGYYKKKLRQDYSHLQTEWVTLQNRLYLVWYFDMPKNYKLVSQQLYLTTLFFDQVIDLNAPVFQGNDFGKAKGILLRMAATMKTYDTHLDLAALEKKLNKG